MVVVFQGERVDRRVHPQTLTYRDPVACRPRNRRLVPLLGLLVHWVILRLITSDVLLNVLVKVVLVVVRNV
jgi:hypothetical protein